MWALPFIGYAGLVLGFAFLTLSIASGLYYLSELVEEHTVLAKKLLTRMIYSVVVALSMLALVDRFPWTLCLLSIGSHLLYAQNLRRFPVVKLTDAVFLSSCGLVLINHYAWFRHFSSPSLLQKQPTYSYSGLYTDTQNIPTFTEVASFFGLCVWLVPFALFVSLSAGENVLPTMGSEYATGEGSSFISPGREPSSVSGGYAVDPGVGTANPSLAPKRRGRSNTANAGMAKAVVTGMRDWVDETGAVMGFWKGENVRPL